MVLEHTLLFFGTNRAARCLWNTVVRVVKQHVRQRQIDDVLNLSRVLERGY